MPKFKKLKYKDIGLTSCLVDKVGKHKFGRVVVG